MYILLLQVLLTECLGLILNTTKDGQSTIVIFNHITANFSISFSDSSYERSAPLIAIEPEDGCNGIKNGAELEGKIVIVKPGGCSFFKKAENVDFYAGKGLVVGHDDGDWPVRMNRPIGKSDEINIPCVFVSESNYDLAIKAISKGNSVIATISPREEYPTGHMWPPKGLTTVIIYMLLIFPLAWTVLVLLRVWARILKRRILNEQVRVIPEVIFNSEKLEAKGIKLTNDSCPICLADFKEKTRIKLLPCDHGFHPECIEPWIRQHKDSCPMCRETVTDKLRPSQRDAACCYNISRQHPLTGGFIEVVNFHDGQEMENFSTTDSSELDDINRVEQHLEHSELNESILLEVEAAEFTTEARELSPYLTIIWSAEEKE